MHLDVDTLERVLHNELDPGREPAVREHLKECADCAGRVAEARDREARIFALFEELDHAPPVDEGAIRRTPGSGRPPPGPAWQRIAATVALVAVAGGALYALPGLPFRAWVTTLRAPVAEEPPSVGSEPVSGLAVRPAVPYRIDFVARQDAGRVRAVLVPAAELEIRVTGAPVGLESAPDGMIVSNAGSVSSYEIRLPVAGPPVEIRLAGVTVLRQAGERVETLAPRDAAGSYILDLRRSP